MVSQLNELGAERRPSAERRSGHGGAWRAFRGRVPPAGTSPIGISAQGARDAKACACYNNCLPLMPNLRIALAQLNTTVGDLPGNQRLIRKAFKRARLQQADLVIVPELAVCGYPPEDLLLKTSFIDRNLEALHSLLPHTKGISALVGFVDRDKRGRLYNAAALLSDGRHRATYHKCCLPNYGVFDERRYFTPGNQSCLAALGDVCFGITICEDLWEPAPIKELAGLGAQLVVNLSASPYYAGKLREREQLFSRRAKANHVAIAYCNLVGGQDELVFDGASLVLDASGKRLIHGFQFREDLLVLDLALPAARKSAKPTVRLTKQASVQAPLAPATRKELGNIEEVYEALVLGLRDYVNKNGFSEVVLGLSGGIDSALTACLAVDALGAGQVHGVVMPSRFSSKDTQRDARQLAKNLNIALHEFSIEPVFRAYLHTLARVFKGCERDITEQNLQARIRGNLLMALSNKFGWLVLTTGNKSETATGYTTLYGDMAGGFAVIKDVPKTMVYRLAAFRNAWGFNPAIPKTIIKRAPTAELAHNQKDQDTLPPYGVLDRILKAYVEEDRSFTSIIKHDRVPAAVVRRVLRMVDRSEYKRRQGPPGIKITPRAFGKDRRMPITNRYQET